MRIFLGRCARISWFVLVLIPFQASAQNPPPAGPFDWQHGTTHLQQYVADTLKARVPERFLLTQKMIRRIALGFGKSRDKLDLGESAVQTALHNKFSPNSKDKTVTFFQSLGRQAYNNSIFVGRAGVGKSFVLDQLVIMFSLGIIPKDYEADLGINAGSPFYDLLKAAFVGQTQFVLINDALLQLDNTKRGAAWSDHETRVKGILHDLFDEATKDFLAHKIRTVFVLEEARNLAPQVQPTLKALVDESGFKDQDDPMAAGAETGFSVLQLTTTEEYGLMLSNEGADAIARRYEVIHFLEPSEKEAYGILNAELPRLKKRYGVEPQDGILHWIIENRRFFSNPPEAMPGGILKVMDNLFKWCSNPKNRKDPTSNKIGIYDALNYKIVANSLPKPIWLPEDGRIPLADLEDRIVEKFAGSEDIVRRIVGRLKAMIRTGREFPFFILMGPPGSGKDTLVRLINEEMFGHDGRHLMFNFANKDGDYIRYVLEGTEKGGLPLLVKRYSRGSPHGVIAFNEVGDAYAMEGIKIFAETGTLYPTGNDPRERPLQLNALFLMGQWGEERFEGLWDDEFDEELSSLSQVELQNILMRGTGPDGVGALPRAVVDRAFLTGGVFILPPVKRKYYPKIVKLHMDHSVIPHALTTRSVLIEYDENFVDLAIALNGWTHGGTRSLEGIVSSLVDGAISKAIDRGFPATDFTIKFTANSQVGELLVDISHGVGSALVTKKISLHPNDLLAQRCEWSFTPSVPSDS